MGGSLSKLDRVAEGGSRSADSGERGALPRPGERPTRESMEAVKLAEVERHLAHKEEAFPSGMVADPGESSRVVAVKRSGEEFELGEDLSALGSDILPAVEIGTPSDGFDLDLESPLAGVGAGSEPEPFADVDPFGGLEPLGDDDPYGGLIPVEDDITPESGVELRHLLPPSERTLPGVVDGTKGRVPRVLLGPGDLTKLPMDPRGGFLLSQIDGVTSLEEILDMCPIPEDEAMQLIGDLELLGVIGY